MPGLLRGVARTAVIAGTATAVSNRVSRRQANRWAQQDQQASTYAQQEHVRARRRARWPRPRPTRSSSSSSSARSHEQGILTDEEFAAQKAKILG